MYYISRENVFLFTFERIHDYLPIMISTSEKNM